MEKDVFKLLRTNKGMVRGGYYSDTTFLLSQMCPKTSRQNGVSISTYLVMPLLVAMMRMGAMSVSSARFRNEKHSMSNM